MAQEGSLSKILSGEPLPTLPDLGDENVELEHFLLNVLSYLRRLTGKFTDQNLAASPSLRAVENNGHIETPSNKDYTLVEYCEFNSVLKRLTHICSSGSCTVNIEIDGVSQTGTGDNTVSTAQGVYTYNDIAVSKGQRIEIAVSASSTPLNLAFTLFREASLT